MGINICIELVIDGKWVPDADLPEWDSIRHTGDKDFMYDIVFEHLDDDGMDFCRPKDFPNARRWVRENVEHARKLLGLLDILESNPNIWISVSW
ncbi:hypothetical protein LCGC14_1283470 [marine sediment metagenome]|uniref:Uncharacterized protein n=1 Tax=marine sediment metagenome TaxID=412755 RepID=A0A0F9KUJ3_9ZZZZ